MRCGWSTAIRPRAGCQRATRWIIMLARWEVRRAWSAAATTRWWWDASCIIRRIIPGWIAATALGEWRGIDDINCVHLREEVRKGKDAPAATTCAAKKKCIVFTIYSGSKSVPSIPWMECRFLLLQLLLYVLAYLLWILLGGIYFAFAYIMCAWRVELSWVGGWTEWEYRIIRIIIIPVIHNSICGCTSSIVERLTKNGGNSKSLEYFNWDINSPSSNG